MKLSFKKEPRERGLAAIGAGEPTINIKADKKRGRLYQFSKLEFC